jgi:hypothetical protein
MFTAISNARYNAVRAIARFLACTFGVQGASTDYLPSTDADLSLWAQNFNTLITAAPATYGLDSAYAVALDGYTDAYVAALATANNPATRTVVTVAAKDAAKAAMKLFIRQGAKIVQATVSVTNENKTALGLPIHNDAPSPVPAPVTHPIIASAGIGPHRVVIRYADQLTPASARKPTGSIGMLMSYKVSATPIVDPGDLETADVVTRQPHEIELQAGDSGKKLYYVARWFTRTGLEGPYSDIGSVTVP